MITRDKMYVNGQWQTPAGSGVAEIVNPATEEVVAKVSLGNEADIDLAVQAARAAFDSWSQTPAAERAVFLDKIVAGLEARTDDLADAITSEMGIPVMLCKGAQIGNPLFTFKEAAELARNYEFETDHGSTHVVREAAGVCGLITPWNFPLNQIGGKLAPALAAGCTVVLKPSELAPLDAFILAEIIDEAGFPPGVFNLVVGAGPVVGEALSSHPEVDVVSITGSTRAGAAVAVAAAPTIKRVCQELGGKSANIILDDADYARSVKGGVRLAMFNTGQACNGPMRMLIPRKDQAEIEEIALKAIETIKVGNPLEDDTYMGPLANKAQYERVLRFIERGIDEGVTVLAGGAGKPEGCDTGYYIKPTIFTNVTNDMLSAQEEAFGPVLCMIPYDTEEEAIAIANDNPYGLSSYIQSSDIERARRVGRQIRAGHVELNGARFDQGAPFGGYRQSGNGREHGQWGLEEYLETKAMIGYIPRKPKPKK
ncbi:MAG: aldehyde dehydrogenase family protein [Porticoccaceae bacterium]|nr:aldehyde dehydrogenase family protein [Porticoccaceae bacterium]